MPNIYATNDGTAQSSANTTGWASCRNEDGTGGTSTFSDDGGTVNYQTWATRVGRFSGRGAPSWILKRAFFTFDTSGISEAPSSATLKIYGFAQTSGDVIALKSDYSSGDGSEAFNDIVNGATPLGNSDGSGTGTFASTSVVEYSSEVSTWSTGAYNDITLNSDALSDMASLDTFKVALMDYDYDYLDIEPSSGSQVGVGMYISRYSGTSRDPYIDYTAATAVTYNATFFGTNF